MNKEERQELLRLLRAKSVKRGDFVLASGVRSNFYFDARLTTMSGRGQLLVGRVGLATLDNLGWQASLIGGLTLGADPIAYAIAYSATLLGRNLDAFTVRKEPKDHGRQKGKLIEGPFVPGVPVVVVEDTVTTGGSALRAIRAVKNAGGVILGVLALVDRMEDGREHLASAGYLLRAIFTAPELLA